jgi:hypothetical protein
VADPLIRLRELTADCLVRIGSDIKGAPDDGGSGVWIAPGTVLTCAHVPDSGPYSTVQVGWREHVLTGTVTDRVPDAPGDELWPYPDVAVVVVEGAPEHPCAWLSEAAPVHDLAVFGHSRQFHEGLRRAEVDGQRGGWQDFGAGRFWQFSGKELAEGMSGGPVLDLISGAVCGITSVSIAQGGYVVPIGALRHLRAQRRQELLRAHDRFHGGDGQWAALRAELSLPSGIPRPPITPAEETELLDLLARFSEADPELEGDAEALLALVARNSVSHRIPLPPPAALRDVPYALLDSGGGPGAEPKLVMSVLQFIHQLVGPAPQPDHFELYNWATTYAAHHELHKELNRLRQAQAQEDTRRGVISVEIVPGTAATDRFRLTVSVQRPPRGRRAIYQDQDPVHTLDQVKRMASDQLLTALGWLGGNALIEFVVPVELFDEPFDELVIPTRPYTTFGRKYCVVLCDYDRPSDELAGDDWHRRWRQIQNSPPGIRSIGCTDAMAPDEFSAELELHPETAIVVLGRRPSSYAQIRTMLQIALDSGVPVAAWRRDTCPEHDANAVDPDCSGWRFRAAFSSLLSQPGIENLPEEVRQLRNRTVMKPLAPADLDLRGTVLLWDNPARAKHSAASLREPPYEPLENAG